MRILIVEDQYLVAQDTLRVLRQAGIECAEPVRSVEDAFITLQHEPVGLVLMDIRLATPTSGVDGAIRIYDEVGIRTIFASGQIDQASRERARRAKPFAWLEKPILPETLVAAVHSAFKELRA